MCDLIFDDTPIDPLPEYGAFLTGSHAYGTPREDSGVDLVMLASLADSFILYDKKENGLDERPTRYGKLNLIVLQNNEHGRTQWQAWRKGTLNLIARRPVTRAEAIIEMTECGVARDYE